MRITIDQHCASCFSQYAGRRLIDFEAAYDGPIINPDDDIKMGIDDLVICEDCLAEAAQKLGWSNNEQAKKQIESLEAKLTEYQLEAKLDQAAISDLAKAQETLAKRQKP